MSESEQAQQSAPQPDSQSPPPPPAQPTTEVPSEAAPEPAQPQATASEVQESTEHSEPPQPEGESRPDAAPQPQSAQPTTQPESGSNPPQSESKSTDSQQESGKSEEPTNTLFVANLTAEECTDEILRATFGQCPGYVGHRLHTKNNSHMAFVEFGSAEQAAEASRIYQGCSLLSEAGGHGGAIRSSGRHCRIEYSKRPPTHLTSRVDQPPSSASASANPMAMSGYMGYPGYGYPANYAAMYAGMTPQQQQMYYQQMMMQQYQQYGYPSADFGQNIPAETPQAGQSADGASAQSAMAIQPQLPGMSMPSMSMPSVSATPQSSSGSSAQPCATLFIANLEVGTTDQDLRALFSRCPGLTQTRTLSKGDQVLGFVEFYNVQYANMAMQAMQGSQELCSRRRGGGLRIEFSRNPGAPKTVPPAAMGGMGMGMGPMGGYGGYGTAANSIPLGGGGGGGQVTAVAGGNRTSAPTLFVANLEPTAMEVQLRPLFEQFPGFRKMRMHSKGTERLCFVEFNELEQASAAMTNMQALHLPGVTRDGGLRIEYSKSTARPGQ
eukprot:GAFH01001268.1.p1 GENE.GAFH01001268.1~~GAFH01001268.1.p1  ORF type:complete len:552 (-),score=99.06 GAFH01001268.1:84-1739(-)